jgi:hypothetical protein
MHDNVCHCVFLLRVNKLFQVPKSSDGKEPECAAATDGAAKHITAQTYTNTYCLVNDK